MGLIPRTANSACVCVAWLDKLYGNFWELRIDVALHLCIHLPSVWSIATGIDSRVVQAVTDIRPFLT